MPSDTFIAIFGLFGSGKTTLARGIIESDGGGKNYENYFVTNGGKYTFLGNYHDCSKYGGADTVKGKTSDVLKEVYLQSKTPFFLTEGKRAASFGPRFLQTFFLSKRQAIIALDCDVDITLDRIAQRSGKIGENSNRKELPGFNRLLDKYVSIGVPVYRINANLNKEIVLKQALQIIGKYE